MSLRKLKWRGIGRLELLAWLNEFIGTDYTKIEHLADGIAYCQIFDALYPDKVKLQKLNFNARTEMEFERNFQVLRRTFHLCDIKKEIPVRKLVHGIFQEHFEFLHWVHDYVHRTYPDAVRSYDGVERRQEVLRQSFSQSLDTNNNLIPKYSAYIELSSMDVPVDEAGINDSSLVGKSGASDDGNVVVCPTVSGDVELDSVDPLMQHVRYSFRSTEQAKCVLKKLEDYMENNIGAVAVKPKPKLKKEGHRGSKSQSTRGKKDKASAVVASEELTEADPMMCRYLSDLFESLESELLGRAKDMEYLEKNIETLLKATPSMQPQN